MPMITEQKANSEAKQDDSIISAQGTSTVKISAPTASVDQTEKEKVNKPLDLVQSVLEQDDDFSLETDDIFQPEDEGEDDKLTIVKQRKTDATERTKNKGLRTYVGCLT